MTEEGPQYIDHDPKTAATNKQRTIRFAVFSGVASCARSVPQRVLQAEKDQSDSARNTGEFVEANGGRVWALRETDKRIQSGWPNEVLR